MLHGDRVSVFQDEKVPEIWCTMRIYLTLLNCTLQNSEDSMLHGVFDYNLLKR